MPFLPTPPTASKQLHDVTSYKINYATTDILVGVVHSMLRKKRASRMGKKDDEDPTALPNTADQATAKVVGSDYF